MIEFVSKDIRLAIKAGYALRLRPREVTYKVSFDLAATEKAHYMSFNRLSNLLVAAGRTSADEKLQAQIAELSKRFRFGDSIRLRQFGHGAQKNAYALKPKPSASQSLPGDVVKCTFRKLPSRTGVPYVSVVATIKSHAFAVVQTERKADKALLAATRFWPCRDKDIAALAEKITKGQGTDEEKTHAILDWLMPGRNIKFGGPVEGSRYGVKQTLKQKYGQCWDFCDLFVTLCRASGVPCRQVAGWLHEKTGHIWCEVLLKGKGWMQVDPTAGMACGSDYIPYLTTEDGQMPIVYLSWPKIEVIDRTFPEPARDEPKGNK